MRMAIQFSPYLLSGPNPKIMSKLEQKMKTVYLLVPIQYQEINNEYKRLFEESSGVLEYHVEKRDIVNEEDLYKAWEDAVAEDKRTQAIVIVGDIIAGYLLKTANDLLGLAQRRGIVVIGTIMGSQAIFHPNYFHCSAPSISIQSRIAARYACFHQKHNPDCNLYLAIAVEKELQECEYVHNAEQVFKDF